MNVLGSASSPHKLLEPDCEVVGVVSHGRELLQRAPELAPDVIVLDIAMPRLNGLDAGRKLKAMLPDVKLIFLTVSEDAALAAEAARIGASAYLLKTSAASALFSAHNPRHGPCFLGIRTIAAIVLARVR